MKQEMTVCDNNECDSVTVEAYGWIIGDLTYSGSGPTVHVEVCGIDCLESGMAHAKERLNYEEYQQREARQVALKQAMLSTVCEVCGALPNFACKTANGVTKQEPHAARRDRGYAIVREAQS